MHIEQPNDFHWCYYHLHMSRKAAKSMAKFISQLCGDSQSAAVCLPRVDGAIERPPKSTHGCQADLRKGLSESRLFNLQQY